MKKINILFVEDDESQIEIFEDALKTFNLENKKKYEVSGLINKNRDDALTCLEENKEIISGAILDLKLESGAIVFEGNAVLDRILSFLRFPIYVVTSNPSEIDPSLKLPKTNPLFKIYARTEIEYIEIINDIVKIQNTGINEIFGTNGKLDEQIKNIYWEHLTQIIDYWIDLDIDPQSKEKAMLRYTSNILHNYLTFNSETKEFDFFVPGEVYIPCMHDIFQPGDIVAKDDKNYIILTPSCDLANAKAKYVIISEIIHSDRGILKDQISIIKKPISNNSDGQKVIDIGIQKTKAEETLKLIMNNTYSNRYYFLPAFKTLLPGVINFQTIVSIPFTELKNYKRVFTVSPSFIKDIVEKFSSYYSRQGSPDFNIEELYPELIKQ